MTAVVAPLAESEVAALLTDRDRAVAAADHERRTREVYAARLNAAGLYVLTVRGLTPRARRQLLALLYGNDKT